MAQLLERIVYASRLAGVFGIGNIIVKGSWILHRRSFYLLPLHAPVASA